MHGYTLDLNEFAPRPKPFNERTDKQWTKCKHFSATDGNGKRLLFSNIKELAKFLCVSRCAIYYAIKRGENNTCQGYHIEAIS